MNGIPLFSTDSPTVVLELIYRLKIKDVMTTKLLTVKKQDSLRTVKNLMKENGITGVPVLEGKRLVGMVSMDDIIRALDDGRIDEASERYMSRSLIILEDDMPLSFGISYFEKYRFGRFPVLDKERRLVGIITSRDIIMSLLLEINKEMEKMEHRIPVPESPPSCSLHKEYTIRKFDFENAGKASTEVKKILKSYEIDAKTVRRIAVASYELEMNQVVHSDGGKIIFTITPLTVTIVASDSGPGIPDVELALQEGYSTANEWIRSLGFGAGMGLPNVKRVADEFSIESSQGTGTCVRAVIHLDRTKEQSSENTGS